VSAGFVFRRYVGVKAGGKVAKFEKTMSTAHAVLKRPDFIKLQEIPILCDGGTRQ
jgi:hypothetical protein